MFTTNPDGLAFTHRALIAQIAAARSLPLSVWSREAMKGGAIMAYAVDQGAICERTAAVADKILKGAKAGELPVEQPIKFELVVSLKAAKASGSMSPPRFASSRMPWWPITRSFEPPQPRRQLQPVSPRTPTYEGPRRGGVRTVPACGDRRPVMRVVLLWLQPVKREPRGSEGVVWPAPSPRSAQIDIG